MNTDRQITVTADMTESERHKVIYDLHAEVDRLWNELERVGHREPELSEFRSARRAAEKALGDNTVLEMRAAMERSGVAI